MRNTLEQQVMASVTLIYTARSLVSRTALEVYALALSCAALVFFVSVPHVISNFEVVMQGGVPSMAGFVVSAIVGTKILVQLALIVGAAGAISLFSNVIRRTASRTSHTALA